MTSAFGKAAEPFIVDVWSDVVCPFCYIGETVFAEALAGFAHKEQVVVRYHSYQLMPDIGTDPVDLGKILGERYSPEQRAAQNRSITERGAELGLTYNFDTALTVNTRTAHRLIQFAQAEGAAGAGHATAAQATAAHDLTLALYKAYFTDGFNVADPEVLADIAESVGLNRERALEVAQGNEFDELVAADIEMARQLGFGGVPFFLVNNTYGVSGAQPLEVFAKTLDAAWAER